MAVHPIGCYAGSVRFSELADFLGRRELKTWSVEVSDHRGSFCRDVLMVIMVALLVLPHIAAGQSLPSNMVDLRYETFRKKSERQITTPGNAFGEQVSFDSGSLSFNIVDISIQGNNELPVELRRLLKIVPWSRDDYLNQYRQGFWELGLPKITASYEKSAGVRTTDSARPTKNCSIANKESLHPPLPAANPESFPVHTFWNPPRLQVPDGSVDLLVYNQGLLSSPSSGGPYYWLTNRMDYVSCIAVLKNAESSTAFLSSGEGFLVRRADGTKYWFDWMGLDRWSRGMSTIVQYSMGTPALVAVGIDVANVAWYPTRVEDRFGNWVSYTYSNRADQPVRLDKIASNDGRVITLAYENGILKSASANGRTWSYANPDNGINPDGSTWKLTGTLRPSVDLAIDKDHGSCHSPATWTGIRNPDFTVGEGPGLTYSISLTNPAGATAEFTMARVMLGRAGVVNRCYASGYSMIYGLPSHVRLINETWIKLRQL
jgi:hypothetical protein